MTRTSRLTSFLMLSAGFAAFQLGVLPVIFGPASAYACPCPQKPNLLKSVNDSSMVLVGRVLDQRSTPLKPGFVEVKVTVLQRFKDQEGMAQETITFYTPEAEDQCGISFQPGYEYVIFLTGNPAFFKANSCTRTEVLENAQVDVQRLAGMKERPLEANDPVPDKPKPSTTKDAIGKGGKGKGVEKEVPPSRDRLEDALRKRNLLSPDAVRNKSRL